MKKILTLGITALAFGLIMSGTPVFADEPVVTSDEPTNCIGSPDMNCTNPTETPVSEIAEPSDEPMTDCIGGENDNPPTDCAAPIQDPNEILSEDECEPGQDCKEIITEECTGDNQGDEECITDEETVEPEQWPMYVSLSALGAAVIIFIALNLFGGKKK